MGLVGSPESLQARSRRRGVKGEDEWLDGDACGDQQESTTVVFRGWKGPNTSASGLEGGVNDGDDGTKDRLEGVLSMRMNGGEVGDGQNLQSPRSSSFLVETRRKGNKLMQTWLTGVAFFSGGGGTESASAARVLGVFTP